MDCCFPDVSYETVETWWLHLKESNKNYLKERAKLKMPFFAATEKMVKNLFNIGHSMELSRDILLTSVTLLDRFMNTSYRIVNKEASPSKKFKMMQKLQENMVLHMCVCLQLASKAVGQRDVLVSDVEKFMVKMKKAVTKREILRAEEYIFKTLNYQIPTHSPLIYIEILVHLLPANKLSLDCTKFCETCAQFMMIAYAQHQVLYDSLYYVLTSKESCRYKDRREFLSVEMDCVYLAGAATLAAARTLDKARAERVARCLQTLTSIPIRELQRLADILTDMVTDDDEGDDKASPSSKATATKAIARKVTD